MIEPIVIFFDKLVEKFTWPRLILIVVVLLLCVFGLLVYESYTGHFRYARIEKETELLDKLIAQNASLPTNSSPIVVNIHKGLLRDLDVSVNPQSDNHSLWYIKALCAAVPWICFAIFIHFTVKLEKNAIGGIIMTTIPFCVIGGFLPTFDHVWINYFGYPWLSFLTMAFLLKNYGPKTPEKAQSGAP